MKLLLASLVITILSAAGFSALYDRVLNAPSVAGDDTYTGNPNSRAGDPDWTARWNLGAKV